MNKNIMKKYLKPMAVNCLIYEQSLCRKYLNYYVLLKQKYQQHIPFAFMDLSIITSINFCQEQKLDFLHFPSYAVVEYWMDGLAVLISYCQIKQIQN